MDARAHSVQDSANFPSVVARVQETILRHAMLRPGDSVGVAISGGADSTALALLLKRLQSEMGFRTFLAHFNHQLRGAESDADESFVRDFAAQQALEIVCGHDDVALRATENGWNLEDAARRLRYGFFASIVREGRAMRIAVAHTADDQAETLIAQIVRGTGPAGLAGIYPVAGHVVRPLIAIRRGELREVLVAAGQAWCEDSTNNDESRLRARIRNRLLPIVESDFQPHIVEHLNRLADLAREDEAFWQILVEDRFHALVKRHNKHDKQLTISAESLFNPMSFACASPQTVEHGSRSNENPTVTLTKRLLRRILQELKGSRAGFTSSHIDDILALALNSSSGCRIDLPSGIVVEKSFGDLIFSRESNRRAGEAEQQLASGPLFAHDLLLSNSPAVAVDIPEIGHRLCLKVIDWPAATRETSVQAIDWACLRAPLVVRNWHSGDAFRPHGRLREHKLKELLRLKRVPVRERATWPVLTSSGSVVWARGFPVAEAFAASATTRRTVVVIEEPL
jgi:tRNA(Ile)-lysidine synthase